MRKSRVALVAALVAAATLALAFAGALPGLAELLRHAPPTGGLTAPPVVALASPFDGAGVGATLTLAGTAVDDAPGVASVEVRLDGGAWRSVAISTRAGPVASWTHTFDALAPGPHRVEARAFDGESYGAPVAIEVKAGAARRPPTVRVLEPADGAGAHAAAALRLSGTVDASAPVASVVVRAGARELGEAVLAPPGALSGAWSLDVPAGALPPGAHELVVVARDAGSAADAESLPRVVRVALGEAGVAPSVRLVSPAPGAGASVDDEPAQCLRARRCVTVAGVLDDPSALATGVSVSLDGGAWRSVESFPGGQVARAGRLATFSFELPVARAYAGVHELRARAESDAATVPARVTFALASPRALALATDGAPGDLTLVPRYVVAAWPDGASASNASWRVDGAPRSSDGVGTLHVTFPRPGLHEVEAVAFDAEGESARATLLLAAANRPPSPTAALPARAATNVTVHATGANSTDLDGAVVAWRWDWGDGATTGWRATPLASHEYALRGTYDVALTVRDDMGLESAPFLSRLVVGNAPPLADFTVETEGPITRATPVAFRDRTTDPDGPPAFLEWDFGDGASSTARDPVHRFPRRGTYSVKLTVWDAAGDYAAATKLVTVLNTPPKADFAWEPRYPKALEKVRLVDLSTPGDGPTLAWEWDLGDGNFTLGKDPVTSWARPGNYSVILRVTDDLGHATNVVKTVTVGNAPPFLAPAAAPAAPRSFDEIRFSANAVDPDGSVARVRWEFGDGATSDSPAATHFFVRPGAYDVKLTAWDDEGARSEATLRVDVGNLPPRARIVAPAEFAYAGVLTKLDGAADDADGAVASARWDVLGGDAAVALDGIDAEHVFPAPGLYRLRFTVTDEAGATSVIERDVEAGIAPPGAFPPVVLVEFPEANATFSGAVRFTGTASSIAPIERVELQLRGTELVLQPFGSPWALVSGKERWSFDFDTRVVENGPLTLVFRVTDARGARADVRVPVTVANVDHGDAERVSLGVTSLRPGERVEGEHVLRGYAHHPAGLLAVRVRVDDGPWSEAQGPANAWSFAIDSLGLKNGQHKVTVRAFRSPVLHRESVVPFIVANHAPIPVVTRTMPGNASGVVPVEGGFSLDGPTGLVRWRVDNEPWREADTTKDAWRLVLDTTGMASGDHTLRLKAYRPGGLESKPLEFRFRVDNPLADDEAPPRPRAGDVRAAPGAGLALTALAAVAAGLLARRRVE